MRQTSLSSLFGSSTRKESRAEEHSRVQDAVKNGGSKEPRQQAESIVWQVSGADGEFHDCDEESQQRFQKACSKGHVTFEFEARGFRYAVNLQEGFQINLKTGKQRTLRKRAHSEISSKTCGTAAGTSSASAAPAKRHTVDSAATKSVGDGAAETSSGSVAPAKRHKGDLAATKSVGDGSVVSAVHDSAHTSSAASTSSMNLATLARKSVTKQTTVGVTPESSVTPKDGADPKAGAAPKVAHPSPAPGDDDSKSANEVLADHFAEMSEIYSIKGDRFRNLAYAKGAKALRAHKVAITAGSQATAIEGIGKSMATKIDEILETGELKALAALKEDPDVITMRELRSVFGIGPVAAGNLIKNRGIRSLEQLRREVTAGKVKLDGPQTIGLRLAEDLHRKIPRAEATEIEKVLMKVKETHHPELTFMICGSYRRRKAESGDIDVLITCKKFKSDQPAIGSTVLKDFVKSLQDTGFITDTLAHGKTKYMGVGKLGAAGGIHRRIDIRCLPWDQFYFGVLYFTGSRENNIKMRLVAIEKGLVLSEYGLEDKASGERVAAESEGEIFAALGLPYLEPQYR